MLTYHKGGVAVKRKWPIFLLLTLLAVAVFTGCSPGIAPENPADEPPVKPYPDPREQELVLYFPHEHGKWLERELRSVLWTGQPLEQLVLEELMAGPRQENLVSFLPAGVTATLERSEEIALLSFSEEIRRVDYRVEALVIQSFVNSITEIDGIEEVQILVDGKQDFLLNNVYIGEPLTHSMLRVARDNYQPIPDCDPLAGESFIEGEILDIHPEQRVIVIDIHYGPDTPNISPEISVQEDVIIHLQDEDFNETQIDFSQLEKGMVVGIILTDQGTARGIITHYFR
jgi:hypothetical protein